MACRVEMVHEYHDNAEDQLRSQQSRACRRESELRRGGRGESGRDGRQESAAGLTRSSSVKANLFSADLLGFAILQGRVVNRPSTTRTACDPPAHFGCPCLLDSFAV